MRVMIIEWYWFHPAFTLPGCFLVLLQPFPFSRFTGLVIKKRRIRKSSTKLSTGYQQVDFFRLR